MRAGADPQKLVIGIPTFGITHKLTNEDFSNIGSLAEGPGNPGENTRERGSLAYFEVCHIFFSSSSGHCGASRSLSRHGGFKAN